MERKERWESLKETRFKARESYQYFALLFASVVKPDRQDLIERIGNNHNRLSELHEDNMHLLQPERFVLKTPLGEYPVRTLVDGACTLSFFCLTMKDILVETIDKGVAGREISIDRAYFSALAEGVTEEVNAALLKLECPKEPMPARKQYFPTLFVSRSDLVNRGKQAGLLNVTTGRLTQMIKDDGFPACHMRDGKSEYFLIDAVNLWLRTHGKDEI